MRRATLAFWAEGAGAAGFRLRSGIGAQPNLIAMAGATKLPTVVSSGLDFVPLAYYHRNAAIDVVGLTDHEAALRHVGTDSIERDLVVLSRYMPLRLESMATFRAAHPVFLLLARPGPFEWLTTELLKDGYALTVVHNAGGFTLSRVERPLAVSPTG